MRWALSQPAACELRRAAVGGRPCQTKDQTCLVSACIQGVGIGRTPLRAVCNTELTRPNDDTP